MTPPVTADATPAVGAPASAGAPRSDLARLLEAALADAYARCRTIEGGAVADYIPELARASPDLFAVAACTVDGEVLSLGDDAHPFTLQSISKPLAYGLALASHGAAIVHAKVGVEPTGDRFNAILRLERGTNRPHNPMVNAGAIAVSSLLARPPAGGLPSLLEGFGAFAGRGALEVDVPVYLSEAATGHRNRAITYLMRHLGMLEGSVDEALDLYFQQCSTLVTCRDLAVIGATLANGGVCPRTGQVALAPEVVAQVLGVMATCGLYDGSGAFAWRVGLPAKSGVAGGIVAVVPGRCALAAFAPPLDAEGNTLRGVRAIEEVASALDLHAFHLREVRVPPRDLGPALEAARAAALAPLAPGEPAGAVADYAAPLRAADPDAFGLAAVAADGREWAVGCAERWFTIQSASAPFTYGLALEAHGLEAVHAKVGKEPSGNPYNAIVFGTRDHRPMNPLVNAGAIAMCSMVPGATATERLQRVLETLGRYAGNERLHVDVPMLLAERQTGDRNRAIACLLRNFDLLDDEAAALELWFQQCSIRVHARLLARMAATLAFGGRNPQTGQQALRPDLVRRVLATLYTCGMNDRTGAFAFEVGLCAKSGIAGGIIAVAPGKLGIGVYAPRVDASGNSVAGVRALAHLSRALDLPLFA